MLTLAATHTITSYTPTSTSLQPNPPSLFTHPHIIHPPPHPHSNLIHHHSSLTLITHTLTPYIPTLPSLQPYPQSLFTHPHPRRLVCTEPGTIPLRDNPHVDLGPDSLLYNLCGALKLKRIVLLNALLHHIVEQ